MAQLLAEKRTRPIRSLDELAADTFESRLGRRARLYQLGAAATPRLMLYML
jgi:hypothetical protein